MIKDRTKWDNRYRKGKRTPLRNTLIRFYSLAPKGRALDIACGTGSNSIFLAKKGFDVVGVDISPVAINKARAKARKERLRHLLHFKVIDIRSFSFKAEQYELMVNFYFLDRILFRRMKTSLKKGGILIFETYNYRYLKFNPDFNPAYTLGKNELLRSFSEFEIIHYSEVSCITTLVAKKP